MMFNKNILTLKTQEPEGEAIDKEMARVRKYLVERKFGIPDSKITEALRKVRTVEPGTQIIIDDTLANVGATLTRQGKAEIILEAMTRARPVRMHGR